MSSARSGIGPAPASTDRVELLPGIELESWFSEGLGNSSYVLSVEGARKLLVIDPWRDADTYLPALARHPSQAVLALETHVHNDFVSGSRELAAERKAGIGASRDAALLYPHRRLAEGDEIPLGRCRLRVWATPGHTPEHVSYLLLGPTGAPLALFSGGALIVGSAARTDLLGPLLARPLAVRLFRTLHERIARLPGSTRVFPTHGGGTFCGKGDPSRRSTTVGEERASNPLLRAPTLDAFLEQLLDQRPYPRYFARMRPLNLAGAPLRGLSPFYVPSLGLTALSRARRKGALVVDLRDYTSFDAGHIPGSYAIGLEGPFSSWAGWLLPPKRPIVFLDTNATSASEAARQLFRIGYDTVVGRVQHGIADWARAARPVRSIPRVTSRRLLRSLRSESPLVVLDVREASEFREGHIPGAVNLPLGELAGRTGEVPPDAPVVVHCEHGYRSAAALSLLEQAGFTSLSHADEGFSGWSTMMRGR